MYSYYDNHDAVNDVIMLRTRGQRSDSEWAEFRKVVEDKGTDCSYRRMLRVILAKEEELRGRESGKNAISAGGLHIKCEAEASGLKSKPGGLLVEKSECPPDKNRRVSDVQGLRISEPDRMITNWSSPKQKGFDDQLEQRRVKNCRKLKGKSAVEEDSEDTKAAVVPINNLSAKGCHHCKCGVRALPRKKDKVRGEGEFGRVGPGEKLTLFRKCAEKDRLDGRNAEVGPGENSSLFRKRAAKDHLDRNAKVALGGNLTLFKAYASKDYLDHNVKAESSRKKQKICGIKNAKAKSTDETDDDVAILEDNGFLNNLRSFVPSKRFHDSMEEDADIRRPGRSSSSKSASDGFRKEVLDVFGQPFDKHELKRLREAVRDGSYYKYYPDLQSKLKTNRYRRGKCLNILRGFFFWLQNVSKEGAFKPWKDGQCLAVEPPSPESSPPPPSSGHLGRAKAKLSKRMSQK